MGASGALVLALVASGCGPEVISPDVDAGGDGGRRFDGSSPCEAPTRSCGGRCVNVQNDPANCGDCGMTCTGGTFCESGMCNRTCSGGLTACGSACVDFASDRAHCGRCDNACPMDRDCRGGSCVCPTGYIECGGTCIDPSTDRANCGRCGNACTGSDVCRADVCTCASGARESDCINGMDDDCDMMIDCMDSDCVGSTRTCSGACGAGTQACQAGGTYGMCMGGDGSAEICGDGIDQDCNGVDLRRPDGWEPNDSCDSCVMLMGTDPNVFLDATFDSVDDPVDCFRFAADDGIDPTENINITLTNIPTGTDYDVYLYRSYTECAAGTVLASSALTSNMDESIGWGERFGIDDGGTYYIRVVRYRGHSCDAQYHLTINGLN